MRAPTQQAILSSPPGRVYYGDGLVLIVRSEDSRSWAFRYTSLVTRKPTEISIGTAYRLTIHDARNQIANMKQLLARGIDPVQAKRLQRAAGITFTQAYEDWSKKNAPRWRSLRQIKALIKHAKPFAHMPMGMITTPIVVKALSELQKRHPEQAYRAASIWARVFDFAKAMNYRTGDNPAAWRGHLENIFSPRVKTHDKHYPSMSFKEVPAFVERLRIRQIKGHSATALEFQIRTAARPGEVRGMRWSELDLINRTWTIPATRTKQKRQHRVPLSERCMEILALQNEYRTNDFVFPSPRTGEALDQKAVRVLLRTMDVRSPEGLRVAPHGFRASFRNWCAHSRQDRDLAEMSLGHNIKGGTEGAYWTDDMLEQRRVVMDAWADYCDSAVPHKATLSLVS